MKIKFFTIPLVCVLSLKLITCGILNKDKDKDTFKKGIENEVEVDEIAVRKKMWREEHLRQVKENQKKAERIEQEKKEIEKQFLNKKNEIKKKEAVTVSRGKIKSTPRTHTSMKSYMDYRAITDKSSKQYKLQHCKDIYTDNEGFRKIGDSFIVAVGTYYTNEVGKCLEVKLSTGRTFKAIVGDIKANNHTDHTNRQHLKDGSVVEFIVDTKNMDQLSKKMGDMSYAKRANLKGDVVSITVVNE